MATDIKIINERIKKLEKCFIKLNNFRNLKLEKFIKDEAVQDQVERNLHISIQICLDIGSHIISTMGLKPPENYSDIFEILGEEKILPKDFSRKIKGMAGLRNILVHDYIKVDKELIHEHLKKIDDFKKFAEYIVKFINKYE